jgi:hypothetical protein
VEIFRKYLYIIYFILLYIGLIAFDYFDNNVFNWFENLIQSTFYALGFLFFNWALNDKDKKKEK